MLSPFGARARARHDDFVLLAKARVAGFPRANVAFGLLSALFEIRDALARGSWVSVLNSAGFQLFVFIVCETIFIRNGFYIILKKDYKY